MLMPRLGEKPEVMTAFIEELLTDGPDMAKEPPEDPRAGDPILLPHLIGHRLLRFSSPQSAPVPVPVAGTSATNH